MAGLKMTCFLAVVAALVCVVAAADKPSFLGKSYKLKVTCDNFDDFMKELGNSTPFFLHNLSLDRALASGMRAPERPKRFSFLPLFRAFRD